MIIKDLGTPWKMALLEVKLHRRAINYTFWNFIPDL